MKTRNISIRALCLILFMIMFGGCATKPVEKVETVFFPPPPNPPRVQYLFSVSDARDVEAEDKSLNLLVVGAQRENLIKKISKPYGVEYANGKIYVCDLQGSTVVVIDLINKTFDYLKGNSGYGKLKRPVNLTIDSEGNIFVVDIFLNSINMYDHAGEFIKSYAHELIKKPNDVAVDDKRIYVLDMQSSDIKVLDRDTGKLVDTFGKTEGETKGLSMPTNLFLDDKGYIYATNIRSFGVLKMDIDGHIIDHFGEVGDGFGQFSRPKGVAVGQQGRIFVVDSGNLNIQIFNKDYRLLMFFGNPPLPAGVMNLPATVAVTTENLDYFQTFAAPGFVLEEVILVTNQAGPHKVSIYGLGQMQ